MHQVDEDYLFILTRDRIGQFSNQLFRLLFSYRINMPELKNKKKKM